MTMTSSSTKGVFLGRVVANRPLCREHFRFTLEVEGFPAARPGQFLQVQCNSPDAPTAPGGAFIRRPFSIAGLRRRGTVCELDVIHRVVGPGTRWLGQLAEGDAVSILGPLGRPFRILDDRPTALLVGGGVGLPPLIWLAEALHAAGKQTVAFCGSRSGDLLPLTRRPGVALGEEACLAVEEFGQYDVPVIVSTDDGSLGVRGRTPEVLDRYLKARPAEHGGMVVYTCGPEPMMRAVAKLCEAGGIPCQVCLERVMACGMGTCQSCVVPVRDPNATDGWRYRLCCTDGPVFESRQIIWTDAH